MVLINCKWIRVELRKFVTTQNSCVYTWYLIVIGKHNHIPEDVEE